MDRNSFKDLDLDEPAKIEQVVKTKNINKHKETCLKNRRKRKRKK